MQTRVAFVNSVLDPAGVNARRHLERLLAEGHGERLLERGISCTFVETRGRLIHAEGIDRSLDADLLVFLSKHTSARPAPLLTVHAPGNFSTSALGGTPYSFPPVHPAMMRAVLQELHRSAPAGYHATYEATHHGPTAIGTPCFFLEIGSTEREWTDGAAGAAIASSMLCALERITDEAIPLLGLGGDHYATRATSLAISTRGAFGHIVPSQEVPSLDGEMLEALMHKGGAAAAYIDRNSLARQELSILEGMLSASGIPVLGERELRGIGALGFRTYLEIRALAHAVHPGARVVVGSLEGEGAPVGFPIQEELLVEARRAGGDRFVEALKTLPVCHLFSREGNLLPSFYTFENCISQSINALIRLCIQTISGCKETSIDGDRLIILETRFDPEKARMLEIPAGPLFKRLSRGEAVEVNGRKVTPEMVQTTSRRILHIPELERYG